MAPSGPPVLEGVFAINKPPAISSAQVIRDVQSHFDPSKLFKPWLDREHAKRDAEGHNQRSKRKWKGRRANNVKMGHGGTLDPLATGVLILGVGSGTKRLNHFTTECTKTYEAVVLFGAATDTYDTEGKIVGRQPYEHITREMVEEALTKFRGKGSQKPPIFSALRMQGKRLYEYAREGLELPEEIKERPVEVHELEMLEWMDGGTHEWHWPDREAEKEEKQFADKILHLGGDAAIKTETGDTEATTKRKRDDENAEGNEEVEATEDTKRLKVEQPTSDEVPSDSKGSAPQTTAETATDDGKAFQPEINSEKKPAITRQPCSAPACRLRMSVTSGFYVRSLCHDLGAAVGSLAILASLVRTRQGEFELGANVLWYDELKQGEDVWGPKVKRLLEESGENKTKPSVEKQSEAKPANANQAEAEEVDIKAEGEKVETKPDTEKVDIKTEAENFDVKTEGEEVDIKTEAVKASEQS